jgi:hypothetical protein
MQEEPSNEVFVLTRIMKSVSLVALLGSVFFWKPAGNYAVLLQFVVCGSATLVVFEAARSDKHLWTVAFVAPAVLFNPLAAVTFSHGVFVWAGTLSFTMFLASLALLKTNPRLSIASITYAGPRTQSL